MSDSPLTLTATQTAPDRSVGLARTPLAKPMMRAARIHAYGPPSNFQIDEVPVPTPGPNDLLIQVFASSVNPVDWKIRKGSQRAAIHLQLPWTLGLDVSGVVAAVGKKVTDFVVGDAVCSSPTHRRPGTYAEYLLVEAKCCAKKPPSLSHLEAASLPLVGLTAWQALIRFARLTKGEHVLILAGSGGVGSVAIQIAKHFGAEVTATCSSRNLEWVRGLGADHVLDYNAPDYESKLANPNKPYDVALDNLGGASRKQCVSLVRRGGRVASVVAGLPAYTERYGALLGLAATGIDISKFIVGARCSKNVRAANVMRPTDGALLKSLFELVEAKSLRAVIDRTFPLEQIAEAHAFSETGRTRGKIAISVRP